MPFIPMPNNPSRETKSFSLGAFHALIAQRAALINRCVSSSQESESSAPKIPVNSRHKKSHSTPLATSSRGRQVSALSRRPRSIATTSECSEFDTRNDEGWIPIIWAGEKQETTMRRSMGRTPIVEETETASEELLSDSTYPSELGEWTPPSTPASPAFRLRLDVGEKSKSTLPSTDASMEETSEWMVESRLHEKS